MSLVCDEFCSAWNIWVLFCSKPIETFFYQNILLRNNFVIFGFVWFRVVKTLWQFSDGQFREVSLRAHNDDARFLFFKDSPPVVQHPSNEFKVISKKKKKSVCLFVCFFLNEIVTNAEEKWRNEEIEVVKMKRMETLKGWDLIVSTQSQCSAW